MRSYSPAPQAYAGLALGPDRQEKPKALVLFLHGYGANGADLMGLGQVLAPHLPQVTFIAPDAPGRLPFGAGAHCWFDLDANLREQVLDEGAQAARPGLHDYITAVLDDFDMPAQQLLICGFSQGGMMALEVSLRLPDAVGQVLCLSGGLVGSHRLVAELRARPPLFLGHGTADPVVPFASMAQSVQHLEAAGLKVTSQAFEGEGHTIPQAALQVLLGQAHHLST